MARDPRGPAKKLGDVLIHEGILTKTQVQEAAKYQRQAQDPLAPYLIRCNFITAWDLAKAVCMYYQMPYMDLTTFKAKKDVVALLEPAFMHGYGVLPLDKFGKIITLAVSEVLSPEILQLVVDRTQLSPYMYIAPYDLIRTRLEEMAPYAAPDSAGAPAAAAAGGGAEDQDWMAIFEEAEKKMKGSDEGEAAGEKKAG
jgi:hypothetical protein